MYTRFRATQTFKELDDEVKNLTNIRSSNSSSNYVTADVFQGLFVLFFAFLEFTIAEAQMFPVGSFIRGSEVPNHRRWYAEHSPHADSTLSYALMNAAMNAAAFKHVTVKADKPFGNRGWQIPDAFLNQEIIDEGEVRKHNGSQDY